MCTHRETSESVTPPESFPSGCVFKMNEKHAGSVRGLGSSPSLPPSLLPDWSSRIHEMTLTIERVDSLSIFLRSFFHRRRRREMCVTFSTLL